MITRRDFNRFGLVATTFPITGGAAQAQLKPRKVKIGVMSDMSGPYADTVGPGTLVAAQLAVEDFRATKVGKDYDVQIISADHQNNVNVGLSIGRQWWTDEGVDTILGPGNTAIGFALNDLAKQLNKVLLVNAVGSVELTGKHCSPNVVHWDQDSWMLAHSTANAIMKNGGKSWFFITVDYSFGKTLEADTAAAVKAYGGTVVGSVRHPLNTTDFASYLLRAQQSRAQVIGLANGGQDSVTAIKQAHEFGIQAGGQRLAGLLIGLVEVQAVGLPAAQGLLLTETFYWDRTPGTRAFTKRYRAAYHGRFPDQDHAGSYSAVLHYLNSLHALDDIHDGRGAVRAMKKGKFDDPLHGVISIREDGRVLQPVYLFQVKKPEESHYDGDLLKIIAETPAAEAYRPLSEGGCYFIPNATSEHS